MSRFNWLDDNYDSPVTYEMWAQATGRALASKRGQAALAAVEEALLQLPAPRLISGHLALGGEVCAVGAYVLAQRIAAGEDRAAVLAQLERMVDDEGSMAAYETARAGSEAGLAYTVAWRLAELNDEDWRGATPERRYEAILAWVRRAQGKPATVAA